MAVPYVLGRSPVEIEEWVPSERTVAVGRPKASFPVVLCGVGLDPVTTGQALERIEQMIESGRPHYIATANVDFLVQSLRDMELRRVLLDAPLVLCDGTPLVWASRWLGQPLPERVAGADLMPELIRLAAEKQYRMFFLGADPRTNEGAVAEVRRQFPRAIIAGHYSPPFKHLLEMDFEDMARRVRGARPDLLFVAFGCPKAEKWMAMHCQSLNVPVSIGVGGTLDFLAGRLKRAPLWVQRAGLEWCYRLWQEPRRLWRRYLRDGWFFGLALGAQWWGAGASPLFFRGNGGRRGSIEPTPEREAFSVKIAGRLEAQAVQPDGGLERFQTDNDWMLDLSGVTFIDNPGIGMLLRLRKALLEAGRRLVLVAPAYSVRRALDCVHLRAFFLVAESRADARRLLDEPRDPWPVRYHARQRSLSWHGEITAANAERVWKLSEPILEALASLRPALRVDLSQVSFVDSAGVAVMMRTAKLARESGVALCFTAPQAIVRRVVCFDRLSRDLLRDCL